MQKMTTKSKSKPSDAERHAARILASAAVKVAVRQSVPEENAAAKTEAKDECE